MLLESGSIAMALGLRKFNRVHVLHFGLCSFLKLPDSASAARNTKRDQNSKGLLGAYLIILTAIIGTVMMLT